MMNKRVKPSTYVLWLCVVGLWLVATGCSSPGLFVADVQAGPVEHRDLVLKYDGDTFVGLAAYNVTAVIRSRDGFPLYGPVSLAGGTAAISSRSRDYKFHTFKAGQPWPAWIAATGYFTPAELVALGVTLEGEDPPPPIPEPVAPPQEREPQ